ncbi:S8 family serine peptidase, partial [candidate division KSB1 bacterium]|nr:S8 family serine peptidase [candidate division KSB1 bacterium]
MVRGGFLFYFIIFCFWLNSVFDLNVHANNSGEKYWIFLSDKNTNALKKQQMDAAELDIQNRAVLRRAKINPDILFDWHDLAIHSDYLRQLEKHDIHPLVVSRWLNAVSAILDSFQLEQVQQLPFVKQVIPVQSYFRKEPPAPTEAPLFPKFEPHDYDYGLSYTHNEMMKVPAVHDLGITGHDVLILMLDSGFSYKNHEAFAQLDVIDEFDFLFQDANTQNEEGLDASSQHNHGTQTLSVIGAFAPGNLIGPAFSSQFILAKTEDVRREVIVEEDNWVAGLEWGERYGADIASSSLGYNDWYTYENFDGNTAITTRAADIAVKKGMVVVNSMGNEGNQAGSIIAPADADSVIAVGAVSSSNTLAYFSSIGPTWDQRIKPDVVAPGVSVRMVSLKSTTDYTFENGTSFSCPLAAGVAALILSAHPELTPIQVRDALRTTADRAEAPNNYVGWGLVNALEAILYHGMVFSNRPTIENPDNNHIVIKIKICTQSISSPNLAFLHFRSGTASPDSIKMEKTSVPFEFKATLAKSENLHIYFSAKDSAGEYRLHPYKAPTTSFRVTGSNPVLFDADKKFLLLQNYPNPFKKFTLLPYYITEEGRVNLKIYNLLGQVVCTLFDRQIKPGDYQAIWYGVDNEQNIVPNGIY